MSRGIIMSISGRKAVIMTQDSDFVKVFLPEGEYDIGQEIDINSTREGFAHKWVLSGSRRWAAVAAVLLIAIMVPVIANTLFMDKTVYAYVTLDINPSTEFSINVQDKIITVQPLNEEGAILLEGAKFTGRDIEYGIEYFLTKANELGYMASDDEGAVIAATVIEDQENKDLEQKVWAVLDRTVQKNEMSVETGVLSATNRIREEAGKVGISAGKYIIALQASDDQLDVDMEEVRNSSIVSVIKNAGGDLHSIMEKARKTNEELERLFEKNSKKLRAGRGNTGSNANSSNANSSNANSGRDNNSRDNNSGDNNSGDNNSGRDNNSGDNNSGRDNNSRDNNSRDNSSRDNSDRDNNSRDNSSRDNSDRDNNSRDNSSRDSSGRDNNGRDNSSRDNNSRDNNGRDSSGRDNNGRDNNGRDSSGRDNNGRDNRDRNESSGIRGKPGVIEDIIMQLFNRK